MQQPADDWRAGIDDWRAGPDLGWCRAGMALAWGLSGFRWEILARAGRVGAGMTVGGWDDDEGSR